MNKNVHVLKVAEPAYDKSEWVFEQACRQNGMSPDEVKEMWTFAHRVQSWDLNAYFVKQWDEQQIYNAKLFVRAFLSVLM